MSMNERTTETAPDIGSREYLLRNVQNDTQQALDCMRQGDWLRADILLKLAIDQLADTGLIP